MIECAALVNQVDGRSDNLKFHSSMPLFAAVAPQQPVFRAALDKYFASNGDLRTISLF